ncbi:hypothetical protein [Candidatus Rhabdochlamydia porcellionis]|jgi:hypothetical protein|uniref:Uncharacterized protein n=1 Tax=Candidatus Rhabdochlamydia porcellionis TaxID=225148 RepID=A0ABX8Z0U0_9BACT|nr:hypothetical protein [Candidatus Rhabdochlamydia porcellionis]QZA59290.1 hypothetical protein RHAB15C_0001176 [Candidatus Rhabdochlamydia porcellionis]
MHPVHSTTNEISQISDAFLRKKYSLTEEYAEKYPGDFAKVLSAARCTEETLQTMNRLEQIQKEASNSMVGLQEDNKELQTRLDNIIELEKKNTQALQKLANSSSELKEMTSNMANMVSICANRIFNPVRNGLQSGFYFLTGHRELAAVLPGENPLAVDPTNPSSIDEKKKCVNLLKFCMVVGGLYLLYVGEQKISCYLSAKG